MRRWKKRRPEIEEKLQQANRRFREARGRLRWSVNDALLPLSIQENHGISELKGDVIIITHNHDLQNRIRDVLESENLKCDAVGRGAEAVSMLKIRKYKLVIADFTRYRRTRIFEFVRRYQPYVKIISIVSDEELAKVLMQRGSYSFLVGRGFDPEQLRTCLVSSLRLQHRVCSLQSNGERCNRSCINSYQTEEDIDFELMDLE